MCVSCVGLIERKMFRKIILRVESIVRVLLDFQTISAKFLYSDLREDLLLSLVWVVTIGELSILQCTVNNTTTNTLIDKQQTKEKRKVLRWTELLMARSELMQRLERESLKKTAFHSLCLRLVQFLGVTWKKQIFKKTKKEEEKYIKQHTANETNTVPTITH